MKKYCFIYLSVILFSCCSIISQKKNRYLEVANQLSRKKAKYIQNDYQMLWIDSINFKGKERTVNEINGVSYIIGRNSEDGNLIGFNIETQQKVFELSNEKLPLSDEHEDINSIYAHNFDSIFIAQTFMISLIDTSGKLIWQFPVNEGNEKYALGNLHGGSPLLYNDKEQCLYVQSYLWKKKQNSPAYYKANIETSINLETSKAEQLPVTHSKLYQKKYYGYGNHVFREIADSLHIYAFPADPNIYTYNRYTGEYKVVGGKSKYQKEPVAMLNWKQGKDKKAKVDLFSLMPFYYKVHYDPFRNCYYRFFSPELPVKNEVGLYNKYIDREYILMIFDESFKLVEEIKVGKHDPTFAFCTSEGFFVYRINKEKKKGLYTVFKVDIQ